MLRWLVAYATVFTLAAVPALEILFVIPAGILAGLHPVPTALVAAIGNFATLLPVILAGDRLRRWWAIRRGRDPDAAARTARRQRARRLVARYGIPGLAFLGPLITGVHVAAFGAIAAGGSRARTLGWFTASLVAWSVAIAVLTTIGVDLLVDPDDLPDLLERVAPTSS